MKKMIYYFALCFIATILCSCNNFLDTVPDSRTELNTSENVRELIAAAYPRSSYAAIVNPRVDFVSDRSDSWTEQNVNTDPFFWNDVNSTGNDSPESIWINCYNSIAKVNYALEAYENLGRPADLEPYIAEAKVIRAFSHFILVTLYAKMYEKGGANDSPGIPYVTEPEKVVIKKYERGTVAKTYELIEKDLTEGLAKLGPDNSYSVPKFHFTKKAANIFAARFYLYKGEWAKVIEHVNTFFPEPTRFITTGAAAGNIEESDPANVYASNNFMPYKTTIAAASSSAQITAIFLSSNTASNVLLTEIVSYLGRNSSTWRYNTATYDTNATITNPTNGTGGYWRYKSFGWSTRNAYYPPKFQEFFYTTTVDATTGSTYVMYPFLRQEEALLCRAEAYAQLDNLDKAIADMNVFCRQRVRSTSVATSDYSESAHVITITKLKTFYNARVSDPGYYMNVYNAYGSAAWSLDKKYVTQFILDCRRNEFMHEGLRYWDMWRFKEPIRHETAAGISNTLYPEDDRWVIQLPQQVILSGIESNPKTNLLSPLWKP